MGKWLILCVWLLMGSCVNGEGVEHLEHLKMYCEVSAIMKESDEIINRINPRLESYKIFVSRIKRQVVAESAGYKVFGFSDPALETLNNVLYQIESDEIKIRQIQITNKILVGLDINDFNVDEIKNGAIKNLVYLKELEEFLDHEFTGMHIANQ